MLASERVQGVPAAADGGDGVTVTRVGDVGDQAFEDCVSEGSGAACGGRWRGVLHLERERDEQRER